MADDGQEPDNKDLEKLEYPQIFEEDVVCPVNRPKKIGVVAELQWESDSDESDSDEDEEGDDEDEEDEIKLGPNQVRVEWLPTKLSEVLQDTEDWETAEEANRLIVLDRALLHGDIVARASDPYGQTGTIIGVNLEVDLEFSTSEHKKNVSSQHIRHIHPFISGAYVVKGSWIGRIERCHVDLHVVFPDGAQCVLQDAPPLGRDGYPFSDSEDFDDSDCITYYPSMPLKVKTLGRKLFKKAKWQQGEFHPTRTKCIITDVTPVNIEVEWIATTNAATEGEWDPPDDDNDPDTLLILDHFEATKWQVGDVSICDPAVRTGPDTATTTTTTTTTATTTAPTTTSTLLTGAHAQRNLSKREKQKLKKARQRQKKKSSPAQNTGIVRCTHTKVDVMWQDRTRETNIEARTLVPVKNLLDSDFWPEDFVIKVSAVDAEEKAEEEDGATSAAVVESPPSTNLPAASAEALQTKGFSVKKIDNVIAKAQRLGIIKKVDAAGRTCVVRWMDREVFKDSALLEEGKKRKKWEGEQEEVSFYEIMCHPDFTYSVGNVVLRLPSMLTDPSEAKVQEEENGEDEEEDDEEDGDEDEDTRASSGGQLSKNQRKKARRRKGQPQVTPHNQAANDKGEKEKEGEGQDKEEKEKEESKGNVAGPQRHGWVGQITKIKGGQLQVVWADKSRTWLDPDTVYALDSDDEDFESDWDSEYGDEDEEEGDEQEVDESHLTARDPVQRTFDTTINESKKWWAEDDSLLLPSRPLPLPTPSLQSPVATDGAAQRNSASLIDDIDSEGEYENASEDDESDDDKNAAAPSIEQEEFDEMAPFGIYGNDSPIGLKVIEGHKFKDDPHQPVNLRLWTAAVVKEWGVLKNLPVGILVRTFASRMDLFKVIIIGPRNTPYANSAFVFDIHLPPGYPDVPPHVHYCSLLNERLNPNLYETGRVCLSLLGTWSGKGVETWNPDESNLLQVIVSIQGLILGTSEPYYLEAGYEKFKGLAAAARSSKLYNESAYLLCLRGMVQIIARPPVPFEKYVIAHFLANGREVIEACEYYLALLEETEEKNNGKGKEKEATEKEKEKEQGKEKETKKEVPALVPDTEEAEEKKQEEKQAPLVLHHRPSRGFCKTLATIFPRLLKALEELEKEHGADIRQPPTEK